MVQPAPGYTEPIAPRCGRYPPHAHCGATCGQRLAPGATQSEGNDLVRPERPLGEFVERGTVGRVEQVVIRDAASVEARAAAADLGAMPQGRGDHPVEVIVAVGHLLTDSRTPHRVAHEED